MKAPIDQQTAEIRLVAKFRKMYPAIIDLISALNNLEPGGTTVTDAKLTVKPTGGISVAYHAHPVRLTIVDGSRKFSLQIDELSKL